jgi:hypothetical protein
MIVGTMVKTVAAVTWPQRMSSDAERRWITKVLVAVRWLWLMIETIK